MASNLRYKLSLAMLLLAGILVSFASGAIVVKYQLLFSENINTAILTTDQLAETIIRSDVGEFKDFSSVERNDIADSRISFIGENHSLAE